MRENARRVQPAASQSAMRHGAAALGVLLGLILSLAAPAGVLGAGGTLAIVRAGGAGLCDAPASTACVSLARGSALDVTGRTANGEWVRAAGRDGSTGWVRAGQLVLFGADALPVVSDWAPAAETTSTPNAGQAGEGKALPSEASPALAGKVTTNGERLNVRTGPGTQYPVAVQLAPGEAVIALGRNSSGDWIRIGRASQTGNLGWVNARFIELAGDASTLPVADQPPVPQVAVTAVPAARGNPGSSAASPGLSGRLVFQERSGGTLNVYELSTGQLRRLTTGADPAASPDGQTVAFWRDQDGQHNLYLIDIDGGNERRILARGEMVRAPSWSPDGNLLAFARVVGQDRCRDAGYGICMPDTFPYNLVLPLKLTDRWGLSVVDRDGGSFRDLPTINSAFTPGWGEPGVLYSGGGIRLTQDGGGADADLSLLAERRYQDPAWQPGGSRFVFHSLEKDHWEIFAANSDGSGVVALTRPDNLAPKLAHNVAPVWSPEGSTIAFLSNRTGQWRLWVMAADGGNQRPLPVEVPIEYNYQGEQVLSWAKGEER